MSCKELIESLKKAADERIRKLWQDAEAEAAKIKAGVALGAEQLRADMDKKKAILAGDRINRAVSEANSKARIVKLSAEKQLSDRLYQAALASLPSLRNSAYEAVFAAMTKELPPLTWQSVRVNPADSALARKHFPGAEVAVDAAISGGMEVSTRDGSIRVVNTFEKRLERAWVDMQPDLIRDAYREVNNAASPAAARRPGVSGRVSSDTDTRQAVAADF